MEILGTFGDSQKISHYKTYFVIWREPTIPEASVFSMQLLERYLGTCVGIHVLVLL